MKVKCEYCQSEINDYDEKCPNCGAVNKNLKRNAIGVPKTIDELKQWYIERNLPDENVTRFFIGKDIKEKRAFGIYKDLETNEFVVYKNKDNGQRAIRYQGPDEAFAVNELYLRLKQEILNQKSRNQNNRSSKPSSRRNSFSIGKLIGRLLIILYISIFVYAFVIALLSPKRGYYKYNDGYYYYQSGDWYTYQDQSGWQRTDADEDLSKNYKDYYESYGYDSDYDIDNFEDSTYYVEPSSSSDSDSSWDSRKRLGFWKQLGFRIIRLGE